MASNALFMEPTIQDFMDEVKNFVLNKGRSNKTTAQVIEMMDRLMNWMRSYPHICLDEYTIMFIFTSLEDENRKLRTKTIQMLKMVFVQSSAIIEAFMYKRSRFKREMIKMALEDRAQGVVFEVLTLLDKMWRYNMMFVEEDLDDLYKLFYDERRYVSKEFANFVSLVVFGYENVYPPASTMSNEKSLTRLVNYINKVDDPSSAMYSVDALFGIHPMLKDWRCMTNKVLQSTQENLSIFQVDTIVEIMVTSIEKATTGTIESLPTLKRIVDESIDTAQYKREIADHFINEAPIIFEIFKDKPHNLAKILKILYLCDVPASFLTTTNENLTLTLDLIDGYLSTTRDISVYHTCQQVIFECHKHPDAPFYEQAKTIRDKSLSTCIESIRLLVEYLELLTEENLEPERHKEMIISMEIAKIAFKLWDACVDNTISDYMKRILDIGVLTEYDIIWISSLDIYCTGMLQSFMILKKNYDIENHEKIREMCNYAMCLCMFIICSSTVDVFVQMDVFLIMSDLLCIFGNTRIGDTNEDISNSEPIYTPSIETTDNIVRFMIERVIGFNLGDDPQERIDFNRKLEHFHTAFSKLLTYDVIPIGYIGNFLLLYTITNSEDVKKALRHALLIVREKDPDLYCNQLLKFFIDRFEGLRTEDNPIADLSGLSDQENDARLLVGLLGENLSWISSGVILFHKMGIDFAMKDVNIQFFAILNPFLGKTTVHSRREIKRYLDTIPKPRFQWGYGKLKNEFNKYDRALRRRTC